MSLSSPSLSDYLVGEQQLSTLHYIPDFVSEAEEARLLTEIHASKAKWVTLSGRRLQNHGGLVRKGLIPAPLPSWLQQLSRLPQPLLDLFPSPDQPPNHVLINAYAPGCGIMPHEDGPLYHPVVLILSLGSPAVLRFWRKQDAGGTGGRPPVASLLALPRSLLVFQDEAYTHCLHGIEEVTQETLDSSVVNLAALQAAAGAVQKATSSPVTQQQQQHQQPQPSSVAADAQVRVTQVNTTQQRQQQQGSGASPADPSSSSQQQKVQQVEQQQQQQQQQEVRTAAATQGAAGRGPVTTGCQCVGSDDVGPPSHADAAGPPLIARQGERVSLTIRRVLKVHKGLGLLRR